jgi:7-cyano-7-deazaguanine reductase
LFAIPRVTQRASLGLDLDIPFFGYDIWNHYEVSWLNPKGKPQVATANFYYACDSQNIIESKSLKLYFNSLNNTPFESLQALSQTITQDLSACAAAPVSVTISPLNNLHNDHAHKDISPLVGTCLDEIDIDVDAFTLNPAYLSTHTQDANETLYSNLLKSNCLVTGQPDWATLWVRYQGKAIAQAGLLRYIVSFRNHQGFHEDCVERIFMDILQRCAPESLTVGARYTRRGGIDINPVRSTHPPTMVFNHRQIRQ